MSASTGESREISPVFAPAGALASSITLGFRAASLYGMHGSTADPSRDPRVQPFDRPFRRKCKRERGAAAP